MNVLEFFASKISTLMRPGIIGHAYLIAGILFHREEANLHLSGLGYHHPHKCRAALANGLAGCSLLPNAKGRLRQLA